MASAKHKDRLIWKLSRLIAHNSQTGVTAMAAKYTSRFFLAAMLFGIAAVSSSQLSAGTTHYRWVDDRGHPVHSDRPPPKGVDYEVITTGSGLKRVVTAEEGAVPPEVKPRVGNEFDQVDEDEAGHNKKNPELCARAKANLEALTTNSKVIMRNDQGEDRVLTAEEIVSEREKAEALISVYCP